MLEDSVRDTKVKGQTCIPIGIFKLGLNYWGGMNTAYKKRFPDMHQGMIEIKDIPNFSKVYMHIGNTHEDTSGCLLVGTYFHKSSDADDFEVYQSAQAYQELYKAIIETVINQKDDGLGAGGEADPDNQLDNANQSTVEAIRNDKEKKGLVQQKGAKDETQ